MPDKLRLQAGKFYVSRRGEVWCCYRVRLDAEEHAQAFCVRVTNNETEYFYLDGRYDHGGKREHCLVAETSTPQE